MGTLSGLAIAVVIKISMGSLWEFYRTGSAIAFPIQSLDRYSLV